jgi:hypothetical protein
VTRALGRAALLGGAAVALLAVLALVDPARPGAYPACPLFALTGLYCPGCGSVRALHRALHGDLAGAWAANKLLVLFALPLGAALVNEGWRWAFGRELVDGFRLPRASVYALVAILVGFAVLRNIPALAVLAPR